MGRRPGKIPGGLPAKPTRQESALITLISMGVCGWSLVVELLILLEQKKLISDKKCRQIIQGAAIGLQAMDDLSPHPALQVAIALMEGQLEGWMGVTRKDD
jgi:hypothetical protein